MNNKIDWRKKKPVYEAIELASLSDEKEISEKADIDMVSFFDKSLSYADFMDYYVRGIEERDNQKYEANLPILF